MSDLCAPLYVVAGSDETLTFWCFVEVMDRMVRNGPRDLFERDQTHVHLSETKLPSRPKRDEEAVIDAPAAAASHGP